jgi:hypothetical protein
MRAAMTSVAALERSLPHVKYKRPVSTIKKTITWKPMRLHATKPRELNSSEPLRASTCRVALHHRLRLGQPFRFGNGGGKWSAGRLAHSTGSPVWLRS